MSGLKSFIWWTWNITSRGQGFYCRGTSFNKCFASKQLQKWFFHLFHSTRHDIQYFSPYGLKTARFLLQYLLILHATNICQICNTDCLMRFKCLAIKGNSWQYFDIAVLLKHWTSPHWLFTTRITPSFPFSTPFKHPFWVWSVDNTYTYTRTRAHTI